MSTRKDWTTGVPIVSYSRCEDCGASWYLPRQRCRSCRSPRVIDIAIGGGGTVVAVTHGGVVGIPGDDSASRGLALVDLDEGVRMMTTCATGAVPGGRVRLSVVARGVDDWVPLAEPWAEDRAR